MAAGTGMQWQTIQLPFAVGLNTKRQTYALEPPALTTCRNVEFDEVGGLRLRKPYASIGVNILGGGTLSNVRKLAVVNDELLCFTSDTLYAWSETISKWVSRGTHLAARVDEATRFGNTSDQVFADRAQVSNLIVYVWTEVQVGTTLCYLAAIDATTGSTVISPTSFGAGYTRPRVIATTTKILVFSLLAGFGLYAVSIDPAAPAFTGGLGTIVASYDELYDVDRDRVADGAVVVVQKAAHDHYIVTRVSATAGVTATATKVQTADSQIAISCDPGGTRIQILRTDTAGTVIRGDLLNATTLADVSVNTSVGTSTNEIVQLTGAHRSVQDGGFYRCYAFWADGPVDVVVDRKIKTNWINTNNATGSEATHLRVMGIAARAFDYNGSIHLWSVFAGDSTAAGMSAGLLLGVRAALQTTYYLHRDDGTLHAKAAWSNGGGEGYYNGHLPGVAQISGTTGYAWCGLRRQIIQLGGTQHTGYGARSPQDVTFSFDDDAARRVIQLGGTAYIAGGLLLQYDGEGLAEVGFAQYPWYFVVGNSAGAGAIPAGSYSFKSTLRWDNARGETERSTTATGFQLVAAGAHKLEISYIPHLHVTRKQGSRRKPAIEIWRTQVNPVDDSPFYLATSKDPSATGDNGYLESDATAYVTSTWDDNMLDANLGVKEQNPENYSPLVRLAPPACSIVIASDSRLFLAGIPGESNRIHYSLLRDEGEIAAFNTTLSFALPTATGSVTGLALMNETLIAFTANAVYAIPGDGFDNGGGGSNYGPPRLLSVDVGALSHDSIALTPQGLVFFSRKGWYRLSRSFDLEYIGAPVESFNADAGGFVAAQVVETQHQVRFLSASRMLTWDYLVNQWSEWTETGGRDVAMWRGTPVFLDTAPKKEQATFTSVAYDMDVETAWIKLNDLQGFGRVRWIETLGSFKADHEQRMRVARDYQTTYFDDRTFTFQTLTVGNPAQTRHGPSQQRVQAIKVRLTIRNLAGATPAYDAVTLTGIALEVGIRPGLNRRLPAY